MQEMNHNKVSLIGIERLRYLTDGPGITTLVGLQGCPLNCVYCLNPQCHDKSTLNLYTPSSLIEELKRDDIYFSATGGGVTFGGGEPLLYPSFINEFRKQAQNEWAGWGTQLKPSYEPIIVARKPCEGSIVDNVMKYGVGGINIDECFNYIMEKNSMKRRK